MVAARIETQAPRGATLMEIVMRQSLALALAALAVEADPEALHVARVASRAMLKDRRAERRVRVAESVEDRRFSV